MYQSWKWHAGESDNSRLSPSVAGHVTDTAQQVSDVEPGMKDGETAPWPRGSDETVFFFLSQVMPAASLRGHFEQYGTVKAVSLNANDHRCDQLSESKSDRVSFTKVWCRQSGWVWHATQAPGDRDACAVTANDGNGMLDAITQVLGKVHCCALQSISAVAAMYTCTSCSRAADAVARHALCAGGVP